MPKNQERIYVPARRAPRLPRDHFAMRPTASERWRAFVYVLLIAVMIGIYLFAHA